LAYDYVNQTDTDNNRFYTTGLSTSQTFVHTANRSRNQIKEALKKRCPSAERPGEPWGASISLKFGAVKNTTPSKKALVGREALPELGEILIHLYADDLKEVQEKFS
jgi:hypothetical protein